MAAVMVQQPVDVLPTGWQVSTDNTGKEYYYNKELNVSQWIRPVLRHPVLVAEDKSKSQLPILIVPHSFQGTNDPVVADDLRRPVPIAKGTHSYSLSRGAPAHMTGGPGEFRIEAREFVIQPDTLSDLKKKLKDRGLSVAGSKPDLIERLR
jgi:hypothetical protein